MNPAPPDARTRRHLFFLLVIALLLRVLVMFYYRTYDLSDPGAAFGYETGRIAQSLVEGHGFASPFARDTGVFARDTGPTAWFPPLHPALEAVAFEVFGLRSVGAAIAMRIFNVICDLFSCVLIFRICRRLWAPRFALLSAWGWAVLPFPIWFSVMLISYGSLSVVLLLAAIDFALSFEPDRRRSWVYLGILWGIAALTNPAILTTVGMCFLFSLCRMPDWKRHLPRVALAAVLAIALVLPWTIRNFRLFHALIPVRGNFWHELYKGNHWGANGENDLALNPGNNPQVLEEYVRLGERGFVMEHKRLATEFIRDNPQGFLRLIRRRVDYFWTMPRLNSFFNNSGISYVQWGFMTLSLLGLTGLAIAAWFEAGSPARFSDRYVWLFGAIMLIYPLPYYVTFPTDRYSYVVEPILLIFALHLLTGFRTLRAHLHPPAPADSAVHVIHTV
jgi:hypothetical protein